MASVRFQGTQADPFTFGPEPIAQQPMTPISAPRTPAREPSTSPFTLQPMAPTRTNNPSTQPVAQQPMTPTPAPTSTMAGVVNDARNAAGRGTSAQQYAQDAIRNFGLKASQANPTSLQPLVDYMRNEGYNASIAPPSSGGYVKGIMLDGHFVKLLDGYDNWTWSVDDNLQPQGGGGATTSDPNSELFMNEVLSRIGALHQPVNDPLAPLYQLMAMQRIQGLQGAPYTAGEDAALTARYMNPLTTARDTELQQNKERIGARGMLPTSGLLDELNKGTNANYQTGVALGSNDLAVRAVDEKQRRQQEALQVLSQVLGFNKGQRSEEDQRGQSIIDLAGMLPAMDERRLTQLIQASGDTSAAQGVNGLLQQQSTALQQQLLHANTQAQRDAAWGEFFGTLLNNWGSLF